LKLQKDELKRLQLNLRRQEVLQKRLQLSLHRHEVLQLLKSPRSFNALMSMVEKGGFPETSSSFVDAYLQVPQNSDTSMDNFSSIAPSSVPDNDGVMTTVNGVALPVVNLSQFNCNILHDDTSDFVVHLWQPADEDLAQCLSEAVAENFEDKINNLVEILQKLRDMASFYLLKRGGETFPRYMDEVTQFQPLVKLFLIHMVKVLMPNSAISIKACQRSATALNKVITGSSGSQAMLKGQSDLVRESEGEHPRCVELKIVGGALYHSSAWQAKDQALGQTVCSSTANEDRVHAIGAPMDLFTVSVIVTVPQEDSTNVISQMSKRITDARSWVLQVALLLVAPTDSIVKLLSPFTNESVIEVHSEDAVCDVDVGGLNLVSTDTSGVTGSSSSSDDDDRNWLAREALRDRHEEKVRQMLEADALLDGFRYLSKENLENAGRTATMSPRGDPCCAFGDNLY
jgi:hypothetical protein